MSPRSWLPFNLAWSRRIRVQVRERRRAEQALSTLHIVAAEVAAALDPVHVAQVAVQQLRERFGYELPSVYFLEADGRLHLAAQLGYADPIYEFTTDIGIIGRVARSLQPVLLCDTSRDPEFIAAANGIQAEICVPILDHGQLRGMINVEDRRMGLLGDDDVRLLESLAHVMATSLRNAQLYSAANRRADELVALQRILAEVTALRSPDELAQLVIDELRDRFSYEFVSIWLPDASGRAVCHGAGGYPVPLTKTVARETGIISRVLRTNHPELVLGPGADLDGADVVPNVCAQAYVPITINEVALGVLSVQSEKPGQFEPDDLEFLGLLARQLAVALDNGRLYRATQLELTERKRTESVLRDREERLQLMARATSDTIWDWDFATDTLWWNERVQTAFGYPPSATGHTLDWWRERLHPDDRQRVADSLTGALESDCTSWSAEYRFLCADGSYAYLLDRAHIRRDDNGQVIRMIGAMLDLTDRQRAADALRASEERFRALVHDLDVGVLVQGPNAEVRLWNQAALTLLGLTEPELVGTSPVDVRRFVVHEDGTPMYPEGYPTAQVMANRQPVRNETVGIDRPGQTGRTWLLINAEPEFDASGEIIEIITTFSDITARRQAEAALEHQALHDALTQLPNRVLLHRRLEHCLASSCDSRPVALLVIDLDRFKDVNDRLGHEYGDLLLKDVAMRLRSALRTSDTIARLGGDEFAVVLPGADATVAQQIAAELLEVLRAPIALGTQGEVQVGASIGAAVYPADASNASELLRFADTAMYRAKRAGGGIAVHQPPPSGAAPTPSLMPRRLPHAA